MVLHLVLEMTLPKLFLFLSILVLLMVFLEIFYSTEYILWCPLA